MIENNIEYSYEKTDNWEVWLQECTDVETQEGVIFVHIYTSKMNKTIIQELRETLKRIFIDKKDDIAFYTKVPSIVKLAKLIRELDVEETVMDKGESATVGLWEYGKCHLH